MKLSRLLNSLEPDSIAGVLSADGRRASEQAPDPDIRSIHYRAQEVKLGGLFVAIPGLTADGHDFIDVAVENGAAAVVVQNPVALKAPVVEVADTRSALSRLAACFYGNPSEQMVLIGITGTNGKTTTAYILETILAAAGPSVGVIGTVNYRYAGRIVDGTVTTPESLDLQRLLHEMRIQGVTHAVIEVSSHALDLHRVDDCWFDIGIFTNLTQDHLDYHKTIEAYWHCKKKLFTENLGKGPKRDRAIAVINCNDPRGQELFDQLDIHRVSIGHAEGHMIRLQQPRTGTEGITGQAATPEGVFPIQSHLVGGHNQENLLCAIGAALALKIPIADIQNGIAAVHNVPGRLESIANPSNRHVYVDYAHTPDALKNVLTSLRAVSSGRLICIFGCGGDRDTEKRPQMGAIAGRLSDLSVVTSDNPRSEDPLAIIEQITAGLQNTGDHCYSPTELSTGFKEKGYVVEPDRRVAIHLGIAASNAGDTVLIAGKGHETYQILKEGTIEFDDRVVAAEALKGLENEAVVSPSAGTAVDNSNPPKDWSVADCLAATSGRLLGGSDHHRFSAVAIDSRTIAADQLYVAIKGDIHDGHQFSAAVVEKGVRGLIISEAKAKDLAWQQWHRNGVACIAVEDTTRALGDLAQYHRRRSAVSVVAITGSNGKTTTRELTAAVVRQRYQTLSTKKNYNNQIGLPLTLLEIEPHHQWVVVELGMNAPGEIDRLAEICMPDVGMITNIGPAHLEGVGSIEGVMHAKGELLGRIHPEGMAILNADDRRLQYLIETMSVPALLLYGNAETATIRASNIVATPQKTQFDLMFPEETIPVHLNIPGAFMVSNALAAAAVGYHLDISTRQVKTALEAVVPVQGRMNIVKTVNRLSIMDDTYNANPGSMAAAFTTLKTLRKQQRGIAILGDMFELGEHAPALHRQVGALAAQSGIDLLFATGEHADSVAQGARAAGLAADRIHTGTKEQIAQAAIECLRPLDWVLIKGSRGMAMEHVVAAIRKWADQTSGPQEKQEADPDRPRSG